MLCEVCAQVRRVLHQRGTGLTRAFSTRNNEVFFPFVTLYIITVEPDPRTNERAESLLVFHTYTYTVYKRMSCTVVVL